MTSDASIPVRPAPHRVVPGLFRLPGWIRILRPANLLMVAGGVVVGSVVAHGPRIVQDGLTFRILLAAASAVLVTMAGYIHNDIRDKSADRINRPDRPVPAGEIAVPIARFVAVATLAAGLFLSALLSSTHVAISLLASSLVVVYNLKAVTWHLWGNLLVAILVSMTLVFGAVTAPIAVSPGDLAGMMSDSRILVALFFAAAVTLAREVAKDIEDMPGDASSGGATIPLKYGARAAFSLIRIIATCVITLASLPYLFLSFSGLYVLTMIPALLILASLLYAEADTDAELAHLHAGRLKWVMTFGLISLGAAAVWPV